jgi:transposase-like protein
VPSNCPFCESATVTAASEKLTSSTYWRCETCGQLWNPERLRSTAAIKERS